MKRYRGENPSYTKWARNWRKGWLFFEPQKKAGARRKRLQSAIEAANMNIHRTVAAGLGNTADFRIHWNGVPSEEAQSAMAEMIQAAYRHFAKEQ